MLRRIVFTLAATLATSTAFAQIPVTDGASIAKNVLNHVESLEQYKQQLDNMRDQLKEAQRMYKSVAGTRDIAGLMNDKLVNQYLPADLQQTYRQVRSGKGAAGISGNLNDIVKMNQARDCALYGSPAVKARCKAEWESYAMNQHVGEAGYERAVAEIDQLQNFVNTIKNTEDPKAMQDLSARIQLNQVKVQAEMNKLQYLQQAEKAREDMRRRNTIDNSVRMLKPGMVRF